MENNTNLTFQVSQKAVIYDPQERKFLLSRYRDSKDKAWAFIGGHLENDVDVTSGLRREIDEEVSGIEYDIVGIVDTFFADGIFRAGYLVLYKGGNPVSADGENGDFTWFTREEMEKEKSCRPGVKQFINSATKMIVSQEYLNDLQRLQADFANYKKRQQESQKELAGYLIEKLVMEITPVLDNFQMATSHVPEDAASSPWVVGIRYIEKQLEKVLSDNGMQVIEAKEGDGFDPRIHEAISQELPEDNSRQVVEGENTEAAAVHEQVVARVLQKGYKIGDKVICPAKVSVK